MVLVEEKCKVSKKTEQHSYFDHMTAEEKSGFLKGAFVMECTQRGEVVQTGTEEPCH